jgi:hypothetical protein
MKFLAELPAGYDDRTRLALRYDNQVIVTHPEHPPLVLGADGQWLEILGGVVQWLEIPSGVVHPAHSSSTC